MKYVAFLALMLSASVAISQDAKPPTSSDEALGDIGAGEPTGQPFPNPFSPPPKRTGTMEADGGYGMESVSGEGDMGMMMMEDMMMGGSAYAEPPGSKTQQFQKGLQRAIQRLKKTKSEREREALRGYIREAFEERYAIMIDSRKRDLDRLKRSIAKLEGDLKRREAAKDRVIEVQMQSVQLAAEGLLELGQLRPVGSGMDAMDGAYDPFGDADAFGMGGDDDSDPFN